MNDKDINPQVRRAAIAILTYLGDHPTAKDTVEGIAKWWVGEDKDLVEGALVALKAQGVIEQRDKNYQLAKSPNRKGMIERALQKIIREGRG